MTKAELIYALRDWDDDDVVVGQYEDTGWDNIIRVDHLMGNLRSGPCIIFGGGSPFSDE